MRKPVIVVVGPTASGKTTFAVELAAAINGEILSGDSRQVYRGMDIGTGKDLWSYNTYSQSIPYHLIDLVEPDDHFDLSSYIKAFELAYNKVSDKGKPIVLCGGSGLYIEAVLKGFSFPMVPVDTESRNILAEKTLDELVDIFKRLPTTSYAAHADLTTKKRAIRAIEISKQLHDNPTLETTKTPYDWLVFGLNPSIEVRYDRINKRLVQRLNEGMVEEAQVLLQKIGPEKLSRFGLEYKFLTKYLTGEIDYETMVQKLEIAIRQFAKRQMTYFRKMEKGGIKIHWVDSNADINQSIQVAKNFLSNF